MEFAHCERIVLVIRECTHMLRIHALYIFSVGGKFSGIGVEIFWRNFKLRKFARILILVGNALYLSYFLFDDSILRMEMLRMSVWGKLLHDSIV